MEYAQKSGYNTARNYLTSIIGAAVIGATVLCGGLEAKAQDLVKSLTAIGKIKNDPTLTKEGRVLANVGVLNDVRIDGTANYEAEKRQKEIVQNQEKILKMIQEQKATGTSTNKLSGYYDLEKNKIVYTSEGKSTKKLKGYYDLEKNKIVYTSEK
jgi:hypothetical protein